MEEHPVIAVTMGDPAGIGPEICLRAATDERVRSRCRPVIVGSYAVLKETAEALSLDIEMIPHPPAAFAGLQKVPRREGAIDVIDLANCAPGEYAVGKTSAVCGRAAWEYIVKAVAMAKTGAAAAVVTAPVHKESLHLAGCPYPGHTELIAALTASRRCCMMLVAGALRVSHVTTHIALKDVPRRVTCERVAEVIELTHRALREMGIARPRIGVAGLNPHCGERGLFGDEDEKEIRPAVERKQREGLFVEGPISPDTVFVKALAGQYDAVVAMYHDQGHIPVKLAGFRLDAASGGGTSVSGVNVTLGLPIIRTSVDHGVAFDIAGKGIASWQSMVDAIELAVDMAEGRRARRD